MQKEINDALNEQIRMEFNAAFLYLSFSVDLREFGLPGMGHWLREQYREECGHALRLISYMGKRGAKVLMPHIARPAYVWESPLDIFVMAHEHERMVSASINSLLSLCMEMKDFATQALMFEYVREQVEEESLVFGIVEELRFSRTRGSADVLLRLDERMGRREQGSDTLWA